MKQQLHISISRFARRCALVCSILIGFSVSAQEYPVQTNISTSAPYLNYLSYYGDQNNHLMITVTNLDFSLPPMLARLRIRIEGNGYELFTNPNATIGQPFLLEAGMPVTISGIDLLPYLQSNNLINPSGVDLNNLPHGFTTICVDVIRESASHQVLSADNCGFLPIQEYQPPQTFTPTCGSVLDTNSMFHNFTWTPPVPFPAGAGIEVLYDFSIHQWVDPNNNSALGGNSILVYEQLDLIAPTTQVSDFDVIFELGRTYVWKVTARVLSNGIPINLIENGGVSAPCTFIYGEAPTLASVLGDGLEIELFTQPSSERKGKAWWTVTDNTPNVGLSTFDAYFVEYRKQPTGNEGFEIPWFSKTLSSFEHFIYQLEPSTTYQVRVSGVIAGTVGNPTPIETFTTPNARVYNCGEADLPFLPTNYTPLENATAGMQVKIGQFMMTITEIVPLGQTGHYAGKGEIPIAFLANARAKVRFEDILIDTEYLVHEGRVDVITEGLANWLDEQYQQFINPYFVDGTIDSAYVQDSVAWVVVDGVAQSFVFDPPNYPIIVNDASGNQYTIYPNGTIIVGTYLSVSETWAVAANETARFGQNANESRGFDPMEHQEWYENYETMQLSDNSFYYVANKSMAKNEIDKVNVQFPPNVTEMSFQLADGTPIGVIDLDGAWDGNKPYLDSGIVKTLNLPSFTSSGKYEVHAFANNEKVGQLNIHVYSKKEKEVIVVPIASTTISDSQIKAELDRTLGEANIDVTVTMNPPWINSTYTPTTTISLPSEVGMLNKYSDDMRDLRDAYFQANPTAPKNKYYLFLVNGFDDPNQTGYMVRGRSMGFVQVSSNPTQMLQTISHELGHGMGALEHTFKNEVIAEGSTNNLMDYSGETNLTKAQWNDLRDLNIVPSLWDNTEDGSLTQVYDLIVSDDLNTNFVITTGTTKMIYTPSGFSFQATVQGQLEFAPCSGGVTSFVCSDTLYVGINLGSAGTISEFLGYFPLDVSTSIGAIVDSIKLIEPNDVIGAQMSRPLTWDVLNSNIHRQFQAYNINATGQLYSEYLDATCTMHGTTFDVTNPLTNDGSQRFGYPLSGGFMNIGERELSIVDEEVPWAGNDCSRCLVTSELYAVHDDYFPHDQSGFAAQNAPTFEYNVNVNSVTVGSPSINVGEQLLNKFKNLINSNLRAGKVHNYMETSQNYHVIGNDQGHLSAEQREIIEHRLAYLYDYTKEINPSEPIEIYVVFENTSINGQYFFIDDFNRFAKDVFNETDLKSKKAILITVPWGRYNSLNGNGQGVGVNYTNDKWAFMPGIYGNVLVDYDKLEPQYANQLYAANSNASGSFALSEFILDVYKYTYKPVKIHIARQEPDGSVSKSIYQPSEYVSGYSYCKQVLLYRKALHNQINDLTVMATVPDGYDGGGSPNYLVGSRDYLKYEVDLARLTSQANSDQWTLFEPSGNYAKLKEKYIDNYKDTYIKYAYQSEFMLWVGNVYFATQSGMSLTTPPAELNSDYYYTPSTWSVVSPIVYSAIDAIGVGLGFVGLDFVSDGIGLAISVVAGDYNQTANYAAAVLIVGVSSAGVKIAREYGPQLASNAKVFYKGATYVLKSGEWKNINKSATYGRVITFFKIDDDVISMSEMNAFVSKLDNGTLTHAQVKSIIDEPTSVARANKLKQLSGINLLADLQAKFVGKPNTLTWLNANSTNQAILNKLDDIPTSAIDVLELDINTLKIHFNGNPELIGCWNKLSVLTTPKKEWVRKSVPIMEKMAANTDEIQDKVVEYYQTFQKPSTSGAPPFSYTTTSNDVVIFDEFAQPRFEPFVPDMKQVGKVSYNPETVANLPAQNSSTLMGSNGNDIADANRWIMSEFPNKVDVLPNGQVKILNDDDVWVTCVWHHHEDGRNIIPVPIEVHNRPLGGASHTGGNSVIDKGLKDFFDTLIL